MPDCTIFIASYISFLFYKKFVLPSKLILKSVVLQEENTFASTDPVGSVGFFFRLCSGQSSVGRRELLPFPRARVEYTARDAQRASISGLSGRGR